MTVTCKTIRLRRYKMDALHIATRGRLSLDADGMVTLGRIETCFAEESDSLRRYDTVIASPERFDRVTSHPVRFDIMGDAGFEITDTLQLVTDGFVTFLEGFRPITYVTHGLYPLAKRLLGLVGDRFDRVITGKDRHDTVSDNPDRYDEEVYR